ncbi:MAG TPA: hypothetical protein VNT79_17805 [Phycisphaerae bacterium]|nr:hypothetical protein [Phycisphaerae bacterium]
MSATRISTRSILSSLPTTAGVMAWCLLCAAPVTGRAQVRWQIVGATGGINGNASANELPISGAGAVIDFCADPGPFQPSVTGTGGVVHEYGIKCLREVEDRATPPAGPPDVWAQAFIKARAFIDGDNTDEVTVEWLNLAYVDQWSDGHLARAAMVLNFSIDLEIVNGPVGAPVLVYYYWEAFGGASTNHECPQPPVCVLEEDPVRIANTFSVGGNELLGGRFDFASPAGLPGWNQKKNQGGAIAANVGDVINISLSSNGSADIASPEPAGIQVGTEADVRFDGKLRITVGYVPPPLPPSSPSPAAEFSLDIGSDAEMSNAPANGNEYFDPGDCYPWGGPPIPTCGLGGIRDDVDIFAGLDVEPFAPDCGVPPASAAPVCQIVGSPPERWFDLDGTDALDFSLTPLLGPAPGTIDYFPSACIYSPEHLAISFDEDGPSRYDGLSCTVPTNSFSSNWGATFGTTAERNEVYYLNTVQSISFPTALPAFAAAIADEITVHAALSNNPDLGTLENDDVDALDFVEDAAVCTYWYFSGDHEATGADPTNGNVLDPGDIYEVVPGGSPQTVVSHAVHLGLPDGVDVRDFEFVWLYNEPVNAVWLALIFSVAPDDPFTPFDESAGLDPTTIHASFFDGATFDYLTTPLGENIDAIATWQDTLVTPSAGACCDQNGCVMTASVAQCNAVGGSFRGLGTDCADVNGDGFPDSCECVGCRGDFNGDLQINGADIQDFTNCITSGGGSNCYCADMDANATWDLNDVDLFVLVLLNGPFPPCP